MKPVVQQLIGKLIISCQAYEDTPLYGPENMAIMAKSAVLGGADGIRACWPQDIRAIKDAVDVPVIGIYKETGNGDPLDHVIITPTLERAKEVVEAGADILALDCTIRESRPFEALEALLRAIRDAYPDIPIMADLATIEEAERAASTGMVDIISTTLSGYTRNTLGQASEKPDVDFVRAVKERVSLPVNAEGRVWELADLDAVMAAGADMVTIGTAVTRPHLITARFKREHDRMLEAQ